jgi:hypothetical protein
MEITDERRTQLAAMIENLCEALVDRSDMPLAIRHLAELKCYILDWSKRPREG